MNMAMLYQQALIMAIEQDRHGIAVMLRYLRRIGDTDGARMIRAVGARLRDVHN